MKYDKKKIDDVVYDLTIRKLNNKTKNDFKNDKKNVVEKKDNEEK
jgi:hypothetical protein